MSRSILKARRTPANAAAAEPSIPSIYQLPSTRRRNALANIQANFNRRYPNNGNKNRRVTFKRKANSNNVHAEHFTIPRRGSNKVAYNQTFYRLTADRDRILGLIHRYYENKIKALQESNASQDFIQVMRDKQASVEVTVAMEFDKAIEKAMNGTRNDGRVDTLHAIGEKILDCEDSIANHQRDLEASIQRMEERRAKELAACLKKTPNADCQGKLNEKYSKMYADTTRTHRLSFQRLLEMYDTQIDALVASLGA